MNIRQAYITMGTMFRAAVMNDVLAKHPVDGVRYTKPVRAVDDIKFMVKVSGVVRTEHHFSKLKIGA